LSYVCVVSPPRAPTTAMTPAQGREHLTMRRSGFPAPIRLERDTSTSAKAPARVAARSDCLFMLSSVVEVVRALCREASGRVKAGFACYSRLGLVNYRYYSFVVFVTASVAAAVAQGAREAAIVRAKATVARELGLSDDALQVAEVAEARWRDSSLGCAARGTVYTPVLTDGFSVVLAAGRDRFVVHVSSDRAVICGAPPAPRTDARDAKLPSQEALAGVRLAEQARVDLSARLSVSREAVAVSAVKAATWTDASLGCPVEGRVYAPALTRGFVIELTANGSTYEYHSDMNVVVTCSGPVKRDRPR
jgi:hypothetical protein